MAENIGAFYKLRDSYKDFVEFIKYEYFEGKVFPFAQNMKLEENMKVVDWKDRYELSFDLEKTKKFDRSYIADSLFHEVEINFLNYLDEAYPGYFNESFDFDIFTSVSKQQMDSNLEASVKFEGDKIPDCEEKVEAICKNHLSYIYKEKLNSTSSSKGFCIRMSDVFLANCNNVKHHDRQEIDFNKKPKLYFIDGFIMEGKTENIIHDFTNGDSKADELCLELDWLWRRKNIDQTTLLEEPRFNFIIFLSFLIKLKKKVEACFGQDVGIYCDRSVFAHYVFNVMNSTDSTNCFDEICKVWLYFFGDYEQSYKIFLNKKVVWPILEFKERAFEFNYYDSKTKLENTYKRFKYILMSFFILNNIGDFISTKHHEFFMFLLDL